MKLELHILNPTKSENSGKSEPTWYSRRKVIETDNILFDPDVISSPISHQLDRLILNDIQITSKAEVEAFIQLLNNSKPCFRH